MWEEGIVVRPQEEQRARVLNQVLGGHCTVGEAAEVLGLSVRQVRRQKRAYEEGGIRALLHGNRGRQPVHALPIELTDRVVGLAQTRYAGCNDQHFTELLAEREEIGLSRSSVRRILRKAGLRSPRKRRAPRHRSRRERMAQEGMLLQIDGSRHDWLEGRGPYLTLIGGIDDATGKVPSALFREQEDAQGYFLLLEEIARSVGVPLAIYRDRHGIFERSNGERMTLAEQLKGRPDPTQFGRLLEELAITSIPARSPQAKGRVERLWGTLQDRLVTELRLAEAATIAEANQVLWRFLPRFNARFAVPPAEEGVAYRPLVGPFEQWFCFKYERTVAADNTLPFGDERIQLLPGRERISYARARVEVHERMDGSLAVFYQGQRLASRCAPKEAPILRTRSGPRPAPTRSLGSMSPPRSGPPLVVNGRPTPDHPWRRDAAIIFTRRTNSLNS
jgi:transposase